VTKKLIKKATRKKVSTKNSSKLKTTTLAAQIEATIKQAMTHPDKDTKGAIHDAALNALRAYLQDSADAAVYKLRGDIEKEITKYVKANLPAMVENLCSSAYIDIV
jgi:hypothetical protein